MRFRCDNCSAQYAIADEKLGKKGVRVKCKKCGEVITVRPPSTHDEAVTDPTMSAPAEDEGRPEGAERESTSVDNPADEDQEESSQRSENFDLGADDELSSALDDILGSEGIGDDEDGDEDEEDENLDRQATRVFNVEEMQQVQAEREQADQDPDDDSAFGAAGGAAGAPTGPSDEDRERVEWYAAVDDEQLGPMSLNEFAQRWEKSDFGSDTLVWKTGFEEWRPVFEIPDFSFLAEESQLAREEESEWAAKVGDETDWSQPEPEDDREDSGIGDEADFGDRAEESDSDDSSGYGSDYFDEDETSSAATAQAFAGADVEWKPSALSALNNLAEEELSSLRPSDPEPEEEDLPFDTDGDMPDGDDAALGESEMEDGDSSLIAQIAAEEEESAKRAEEERVVQERQAESLKKKEEEQALAAQQAASREKAEEQRERAAPPEEKYIPQRAALPRWAIGLMVGGGFLVLVLIGFLGFFIYKLSPGPDQPVANGVQQPVVPPKTGGTDVQPATGPETSPADKPGQPKDGQPATGPAASTDAKPSGDSPTVGPDGKPIEAAGVQPATGPKDPVKPVAKPEKKPDLVKKPVPKSKRKRRKKARRDPVVAKVKDPPIKEDKPVVAKKPIRKKPSGDVLDFEDPDDRAFASEVGIKRKPSDTPKVEKKKELPPLQKSDIFAVMKSRLEEFKACNRKQKQRDSSVRGKMVISFTISPSGKVARVTLSPKTAQFKGTFVAGCIQGIIKRLKFPKFGGGPKTVPFPFTVN